MFYNELDLLEIRLNELNDVVDYFVIVESTRSHQNKPKPLYFEINKEKFLNFLPKIKHVVVPDGVFTDNNSMQNDIIQRSFIKNGLADADKNDLVLISDLDEIPSKESISRAIQKNKTPLIFNQYMHYYYLNTKLLINGSEYNCGTSLVNKEIFFENTELTRQSSKYRFEILENGGWHFSFLGDTKHVLNKLQNYAHSEFSHISEEQIKNRLEQMQDPLGRGSAYEIKCENDISYLPDYIKNNLNRFKHLIKDCQL